MSGRAAYLLRRFRRDEEGATLVEFAMVIVVFLLILFGLIDFGRYAFHLVATERAMHVAARVAAVRPPACAGVPAIHTRSASSTTAPEFGTSCNAGADICANAGTITCAGSAGNATAAEVWGLVQGTMPNDATIADLQFSYGYDANLGFLGGPYVPVVTVELSNVTFRFVSPLAALVALAGGAADPALGADITLPAMSVSLPGEDLAQGADG